MSRPRGMGEAVHERAARRRPRRVALEELILAGRPAMRARAGTATPRRPWSRTLGGSARASSSSRSQGPTTTVTVSSARPSPPGPRVSSCARRSSVTRPRADPGVELPAFRRARHARALGNLAPFDRPRFASVVGVTGSAGKTTTKEMTAAILAAPRPDRGAPPGTSTTFGLPLTLHRQDARAVGARDGDVHAREITRLAEIADPDVGVVVNVREVHLGNFGSIDEIARAKGEIFPGDARQRDRGLQRRRPARAVSRGEDPSPAGGSPSPWAPPADVIGRDVEDEHRAGRPLPPERGRDRPRRAPAMSARTTSRTRWRRSRSLAAGPLAARRALAPFRRSARADARRGRPPGRRHRPRGRHLQLEPLRRWRRPRLSRGDVLAAGGLVAGDMLELGPRAAEFTARWASRPRARASRSRRRGSAGRGDGLGAAHLGLTVTRRFRFRGARGRRGGRSRPAISRSSRARAASRWRRCLGAFGGWRPAVMLYHLFYPLHTAYRSSTSSGTSRSARCSRR